MAQLGFVLFLFLWAGTASAFQLHHQFPQLSTTRHQASSSSLFALVNKREKENEEESWDFLQNSRMSKANIGAPFSPLVVPSNCSNNCSSKNDLGQDSNSNMVLCHSVKVLWGTLFFWLINPLCVVASAKTTLYSEKYNFWGNFFIEMAPGLPMVLIVFGVLSFGFGSLKSDLKSDMNSLKSDLKSDITKLEGKIEQEIGSVNARLDVLIRTIDGRLENQDQKVDNAIKELELQKREIEIGKKQ